MLWANLGLLFFLSLFPFTHGVDGRDGVRQDPDGVLRVEPPGGGPRVQVLLFALIHAKGQTPYLRDAVGADRKGKVSPLLYVAGIALSFVSPWLGLGLLHRRRGDLAGPGPTAGAVHRGARGGGVTRSHRIARDSPSSTWGSTSSTSRSGSSFPVPSCSLPRLCR